MQQMTLQAGPLCQGADRRDTLLLVYDYQQTAILRGSLLAQLSPQEYVLIMALLRQRERWQTTQRRSAVCLSVKRLCAIARTESEQSVHHALNCAKRKVEGLGIEVIRYHDRYLVLFAHEVEDEREEEAAEEDAPLVLVSR